VPENASANASVKVSEPSTHVVIILGMVVLCLTGIGFYFVSIAREYQLLKGRMRDEFEQISQHDSPMLHDR
jgi:cytochrome b subunit of formate dehydrogenase